MADAALPRTILLLALFTATAGPATAANHICYIQRVSASERVAADGREPAVNVFSRWSRVTIRRRDGSREQVDPDLARLLLLQQRQGLPNPRRRDALPPAMPEDALEPGRFTLAEGDEASASVVHNACHFTAKVSNGVLGVEAKATHCMHGECQTSSAFIAPQPRCNVERVAAITQPPGLLIFARWTQVDIEQLGNPHEAQPFRFTRQRYEEDLRLSRSVASVAKPVRSQDASKFTLFPGERAHASDGDYRCVFTATQRNGVLGVDVQETPCAAGTCSPTAEFIQPTTPP